MFESNGGGIQPKKKKVSIMLVATLTGTDLNESY